DYNFVLVDNLNANTLNYQANQSKTERFLYGIDRFKGEYKIQGKQAYIYGLVGSDKDVILHEDLNIQDVSIEVDASGFHTWAKGFGDKDESKEDADYELEVEYVSPLVEKYGYIEGPAIRDGSYKHKDALTEAVKKQVENSVKISTTVTAIDLTNNGYPEMQFEEGDRVWLYVTDLKQNQQVRVVEIEETFDWEGNIIDAQYTLGNEGIAARYKSQQYNTLSDFRDIQNGKKTLEFNWLPEAIKRASDIINGNLDSHFEYHAGEIIGINKSNPNGYMRFNTDGIGFSRDGGKTYRSAMTYEGIVADAITTGTLRSILVEAVDIYGSYIESSTSPTNYTKIEDSKITQRGQFKRLWRGENKNHDVETEMTNGWIRFKDRLHTTNKLNFSVFGISTFLNGEGDDDGDSSGTIEFFSRSFNPDANGLSIFSSGTMGFDVSTLHARSSYSATLESTDNGIRLHPYSDTTKRDFWFTKSTDGLDGYLTFGDNSKKGLRFNRSSKGLVQVVDGNNRTGGDTTIEAGYGEFNTVRARGNNNYLNLHNENMFKVGFDSDDSPRVASEVISRRTASNSANVFITESGTLGRSSSSERYKVNIEKQFDDRNAQLEHSKKILNLDIKKWNDKFETETLCKEIEAGKRLSAENFRIDKYVGLTSEDVQSVGLDEHVEKSVEGLEGI